MVVAQEAVTITLRTIMNDTHTLTEEEKIQLLSNNKEKIPPIIKDIKESIIDEYLDIRDVDIELDTDTLVATINISYKDTITKQQYALTINTDIEIDRNANNKRNTMMYHLATQIHDSICEKWLEYYRNNKTLTRTIMDNTMTEKQMAEILQDMRPICRKKTMFDDKLLDNIETRICLDRLRNGVYSRYIMTQREEELMHKLTTQKIINSRIEDTKKSILSRNEHVESIDLIVHYANCDNAHTNVEKFDFDTTWAVIEYANYFSLESPEELGSSNRYKNMPYPEAVTYIVTFKDSTVKRKDYEFINITNYDSCYNDGFSKFDDAIDSTLENIINSSEISDSLQDQPIPIQESVITEEEEREIQECVLKKEKGIRHDYIMNDRDKYIMHKYNQISQINTMIDFYKNLIISNDKRVESIDLTVHYACCDDIDNNLKKFNFSNIQAQKEYANYFSIIDPKFSSIDRYANVPYPESVTYVVTFKNGFKRNEHRFIDINAKCADYFLAFGNQVHEHLKQIIGK